MTEIACPICGEIHTGCPFKCKCGYEELKLAPKDYRDENKVLFAIYKFSKSIFNKQIEWQQSKCTLIDYGDNRVGIYEIFDDRAVAYVDLKKENKSIEATGGVLACKYNVKSLIINADYLSHEMLDESHVRMIFIGDRVKDIPAGFIGVSLKYLEVDKNNPYFTSQNNVLFDKKMKKLLLYCDSKPDEEYRIPESVKVVSRWAFINYSNEHDTLKIIRCSKDVKFEVPNCTPSPYDKIQIIRDK